MADALKDFFSPTLAETLAEELGRAHPGFDRERFVELAIGGLEALALLDRGRQFAAALTATLPSDFHAAADVLVASLPDAEAPRDGVAMAPFRYFPHTVWVSQHGVEHPERALELLHALTQLFTAEWAIRTFLVSHPELTWNTLATWVSDPSPHVRRLVSEGTRTRLPWGKQVPGLFEAPQRTIEQLERLRDDPSEYVRRSVANNLNDLTKDFPDLVVATCSRWLEDAGPQRRTLVEHALRTLVKRSLPQALALLGASQAAVAVVDLGCSPATASIGDRVRITATVRSEADAEQHLVVDLGVGFIKARPGSVGRKVFKVARFDLAAGATRKVGVTISLAQHTTRKHYPGRHEVELVVNGQVVATTAFDLLAPP